MDIWLMIHYNTLIFTVLLGVQQWVDATHHHHHPQADHHHHEVDDDQQETHQETHQETQQTRLS